MNDGNLNPGHVMRSLLVLGCLFGMAVSATTAAIDRPEIEWDLCPPDERMRVYVRENPKRDPYGEKQWKLREAVELRLRSVQLYDENSDSKLAVHFILGEYVPGSQHFAYYWIGVEYSRRLAHEPWSGWTGLYPVWKSGIAGQGHFPWVMDAMNELLDDFLVDYMRVRDEAECREFRQSFGLARNPQ